MAKNSRRPPVPPPVSFRLVFLSVLGLSILSLVGGIFLVFGPQNQANKIMIDACSTGWKMGFSALAGMLAGRKLP